ncbi:MAG TPA: M56 family metallopeptidase [Rhodanobacter sp.]|nr:M56 family metallopeptidase [Rhodanobacter sp.]
MAAHTIWFTLIQVIGWTLVHFLWQGALLGLLYFSLRPILARGAARYRFGMAILFALALCPLISMWQLLDAVSSTTAAGQALPMPLIVGQPIAGAAGDAISGFDVLLPWLVLAWSLGVLLHSVRAWRQWRALKMLVRVAEQLPQWQQRVTDMAGRFALHRRITVLGSRIISSPVLIGWVRPVILLPMAVASGFPLSQVELILAHELAHLRRWDPLANLFQVALETVHFYHPVVRWISRDVSNEREICCDELALALGGGSRREFVKVLAELGDLRERQNNLLLAVNGGALLDRVQLMMLPGKQVAQARKAAHVVALVLGAALVILTLRLRAIQARMNEGMDSAIRQLTALVLPASVPLATPSMAWHVPNLVQIPLATVKLIAAQVEAEPDRPVSPLKPVALPTLTAIPAIDLKSSQLGTQVLRAPRLAAAPATIATPTPIQVRQPVYPPSALNQGIEGNVVVEFSLGTDGSVRDLRLVSSTPAGVFDQAALDAMRFWKYALPAAAAPTRYRQTVSFALSGARSGREDSKRVSTRDIQARSVCQVRTGTHICRWPEDGAASDAVASGVVSR